MAMVNGDSIALITGASSGIGAEFARQLAAQGHQLIMVARRQERLRQFKAEIESQFNVTAEICAADLSQPDGIETIVKRIESLPQLTYLINNAGFGTRGLFGDTDPVKQEEMVRLHVMATMRLTQSAVQIMRRQNQGYIINVSSIAAFITGPENVNYCATKAYINSFSKSLQLELRNTKVKVQALCPGYTYSEFHDRPEMDGFERASTPSYLWMTASDVVADSLQNLSRNKVEVIPGLFYKLMVSGLNNRLLRLPIVLYQRFLGK